MTAHPEELRYTLGLDDNDPYVNAYMEAFKDLGHLTSRLKSFYIDVGPSRTATQASNRIAKQIPSDVELIFLLSDDIGCIPNWDDTLRAAFGDIDNFTLPRILWIDDGYWSYGVVMTYYIANIAYYHRIGHILFEGYTGMFSDKENHEVAHILNAVINAPHIQMQHRHYSKGYNPPDATYARRNNNDEYGTNEKLFLERKSRNFDIT